MPELERFTVIVLRRPANAPDLPEAELDRLQEAHLDFMAAERAAGTLLVNGPFDERPDESWRGLCIYTVGFEEAQRIAANDPLVLAGRLELQPLGWLVPPGLLPS
ncbi:MAG TPA: YciI family protein [Gaiellaceae bacterium]|nr:YciI family protein [Gaiellaceae bacterium]